MADAINEAISLAIDRMSQTATSILLIESYHVTVVRTTYEVLVWFCLYTCDFIDTLASVIWFIILIKTWRQHSVTLPPSSPTRLPRHNAQIPRNNHRPISEGLLGRRGGVETVGIVAGSEGVLLAGGESYCGGSDGSNGRRDKEWDGGRGGRRGGCGGIFVVWHRGDGCWHVTFFFCMFLRTCGVVFSCDRHGRDGCWHGNVFLIWFLRTCGIYFSLWSWPRLGRGLITLWTLCNTITWAITWWIFPRPHSVHSVQNTFLIIAVDEKWSFGAAKQRWVFTRDDFMFVEQKVSTGAMDVDMWPFYVKMKDGVHRPACHKLVRFYEVLM